MNRTALLKLLGFDACASFLIGVYLSGASGPIIAVAFISGVASIGFALTLINQLINEAGERKFTSRGLLKSTIYLAIMGILVSAVIVSVTHSDAAAVFTVTAEGLGFIGLALVELTIFLMGKEVEEAKVPRLSIEYDPRGTPDLYVSETELLTAEPQADTGVVYGPEGPISAPRFRLIRHSLRVVVGNTGPIVAESCTAELRIVETSSPAVRRPSAEPKGLIWETSQDTHQDIAALAGHATLNVVFSDTRLTAEGQTDGANPVETPLYALVATPDSVRMIPSGVIRAQDGLGRGEFVVELTIIARNGAHLSARFRIRVTNEWRQLAMDKIS